MASRLLAAAASVAALLPWGACGLRLSQAPAQASEGWPKAQGALKDLIERAAKNVSVPKDSQEARHNMTPGTMVVDWEITDLEPLAHVQITWVDGHCGNRMADHGTCTLSRLGNFGQNTVYFHVDTPLNGTEKLVFQMLVVVWDIPIATLGAECPICGGTCQLVIPGVDTFTLTMPACPVLPTNSINLNYVALDFSQFPPPDMRVEADAEFTVERASGGVVGTVGAHMYF